MANQKIRLATSSPGTQATTKETIAQLHQIARRAALEKADILCLPEAYLGGYPRGSSFGCEVGSRTAQGRDEYLEYFKAAVDLGDTVGEGGAGAGEAWVKRQLGSQQLGERAAGDRNAVKRGDGTREELERIASETGVFIVTGLIEKAGGSLYCAAVYICPKLGMIGKRRKTQPTGTERLIWAQGSPATLKAVSTTIRGVRINLAAAICWENYMPLLRQALYQQNVNLYLAPTADNRDAWLGLMRTVGLEGRCFVVSSNMCIRNGGNERNHASGAAVDNRGSTNGISSNGHVASSNGAAAAAVAITGEPLNGIPDSHPRGSGRRNSCFTEEGFEIALPGATGGNDVKGDKNAAEAAQLHHHHPVRKERRRSSIIDEDGNEIVLCSLDAATASADAIDEEDDDDDDEDDRPGQTNGAVLPHRSADTTAAAPPAASPPSSSTAPSRPRHSTFGLPSPVSPKAAPQVGGRAGSGGFVSRGGSAIVSPFGDVLAGPQWEDEHGIIYADVDFDDCVRGRLDLDVAGSYSRNDTFHFSVEGLDLDPLPYY